MYFMKQAFIKVVATYKIFISRHNINTYIVVARYKLNEIGTAIVL